MQPSSPSITSSNHTIFILRVAEHRLPIPVSPPVPSPLHSTPSTPSASTPTQTHSAPTCPTPSPLTPSPGSLAPPLPITLPGSLTALCLFCLSPQAHGLLQETPPSPLLTLSWTTLPSFKVCLPHTFSPSFSPTMILTPRSPCLL